MPSPECRICSPKPRPMLLPCKDKTLLEAGCDEAGRGCLAGPVYAAAVVLRQGLSDPRLNDSKQLSDHQRRQLREVIEREALCWAVGVVSNEEIDRLNILRASILAMHRAIAKLTVRPQLLLIDGNRFLPFEDIPYETVVKGDATYQSIAAASILAKTYRDDYMERLHEQFPHYHWDENKGYPTRAHREAILQWGVTPHHRRTFNLLGSDLQLTLPLA